MSWYREGVISLTNGSKTVTGVGTNWVDNVLPAGIFMTPTGMYEVEGVVSDTSLLLATPYAGPTVSGNAYAIIPTQGFVPTLAKKVGTLLANLGQLKDAYEAGDLAEVGDLLGKLDTVSLTGEGGFAVPAWKPDADAVLRTLANELTDFSVPGGRYGVKSDGLTDDTLALIKAMKRCRDTGRVLILKGTTRLVAASVPFGSRYAGQGGNVIAGCSMIALAGARLDIEGKIGIDLSGIQDTLVSKINIVTTGFQMTEAERDNSSPTPLQSLGPATKRTARYEQVSIVHTVSNMNGSVRGSGGIQEYGAKVFSANLVRIENSTVAIYADTCDQVSITDPAGSNVQTLIYLSRPKNWSVLNPTLLNTKDQARYWVGKSATPARAVNGMDAVLVEFGGPGRCLGVDATWPLERATYIQSRDVEISGKVLNGDGFKAVGSSRNDIAANIFFNGVHVTLDSDYEALPGRSQPTLATSYLSKNVTLQSSGISQPGGTAVRALMSAGGFPSTQEDIRVIDCYGENVSTAVLIEMMPQTAAQLAAIDPAQTFVAVKRLLIRNSRVKKSALRQLGSLVVMRDNDASSDAKANYALEDLVIEDNTIEMQAGTEDDWIFDLRYINGVTSSDTKVNRSFAAGGFPAAAPVVPLANLTINERNLKFTGSGGALMAKFGNMSLRNGSFLEFTDTSYPAIKVSVSTELFEDGTAASGLRKFRAVGKGYYLHGGALPGVVKAEAAGNFYVGKALAAGGLTNVVGTPPLGLNVVASNFEIRGDLSPTVPYVVEVSVG